MTDKIIQINNFSLHRLMFQITYKVEQAKILHSLLKKFPKAGILWIDAHADINTFETSPTGNIHGMPVAALTGMISKQDLFSGDWTCDFLNPKQIV